jgi:hypothetical protein
MPILYWNDVALEANRVSHTDGSKEQNGPTLSSRAMAIVHLAMYDAYAGARGNPGTLPAYLPALAPPGGTVSVEAAVAAAAHGTLSKLFPSQKAFFDLKHQQASITGTVAAIDAGHHFGLKVADAILTLRKDDPDAKDDGHASSMARGRHRVDPDNTGQGYHAPFYGMKSKCFAVSMRHGLKEPPQPGDASYTTALRQVRGKGIALEQMGALPATFTKRTIDETTIGLFWGYDGASGLGTPPRLYNQIVRQVAVVQNVGPNANDAHAKLFAMVNAAMADAGILAWEQKYIHDLWRPVVGIREHDGSMGPAGAGNNNLNNDCDPSWLPLGAPATNSTGKNFTPPFPAYPSGHATFGAAAFQTVRRFYGVVADGPDTLFNGLTFVSDELNGINKDNKGTVRPRHVRNFPRGLWQMILENGRSRVFLGVHWVFDAFAVDGADNPDLTQNVGGVKLGLKIANDIYDTNLTKSTV